MYFIATDVFAVSDLSDISFCSHSSICPLNWGTEVFLVLFFFLWTLNFKEWLILFAQAILHACLEPRNVGRGKFFDCVVDIYMKNTSLGV